MESPNPAASFNYSPFLPLVARFQLSLWFHSGTEEVNGSSLGVIGANFSSGYLCSLPIAGGWPFIFYTYGSLGAVWVLVWVLVAHDSPEDHPRINTKELRLIQKHRASFANGPEITENSKIPVRSIFTSVPFLALLVTSGAYIWVLNFLNTYLPLYINRQLHFNARASGILSSLPSIVAIVTGSLAAVAADRIHTGSLLSVTNNRKLFQTIGLGVPSGVLFTMGFLPPRDGATVVAMLCAVAGFHRVCSSGFRINPLDLAPRLAGTISGITQTFSNLTQIINIMVTSAVIADSHEQVTMASVHSAISSTQIPNHTAAASPTFTADPPQCNGESEPSSSSQQQQQSPQPSAKHLVKRTAAQERQAVAAGNNGNSYAPRFDGDGSQPSCSVSLQDKTTSSCYVTGNGKETKTLHVTNLDSQHTEAKSNTEKSPCHRTAATDTTEARAGGHGGKGQIAEKTLEEEPAISLSRTSSLLREVHQLAEEDEEVVNESRVAAADEDYSQDGSSADQVGVADLNNGITVQRSQMRDVEEPITYHVLENSHLVKLEPVTEHESSVVASAEVPEGEEDGGGGGGFDGHTITLVEDEHNAGTFKIAQIGDDNTLRVIDNDRIVVFQDETAVSTVCKEENLGMRVDNAKVPADGEEEYSSVSNAFSNGDNADVPGGGYITTSNSTPTFSNSNNVRMYEDGESTQTRLQRRFREGGDSQSFVSYEHHGATERAPTAVATYAHTSIMRPLHSEPASHAAGHNPRASSAPGSGSSNSSNSGCQMKSWHYPAKDNTHSAPPNVQTHFTGDGSGSTPYRHTAPSVGSSSCGPETTPVGVANQQQQQQTQTYPEYGVSSSSSSATSHGSYGGHGNTGQLDSTMSYSVTEGADQKVVMGTGYGHPHATAYAAIPPSYMAGTGPAYVGYPTGDINRPWHAAKSTETSDHHHSDRKTAIYHQQQQQKHHHHHHHQHLHQQPQQPPPPPPQQQHPQQQQHHGGSYPASQHSPVVVRPYPTYPGWENASSQRQLRYMTATTSSSRGRRSSRVNKGCLSAVPVQTAQATPAQLSTVGTRAPIPVPVNPAVIGRPRKRSAVQADASTVSKAGYEQANIALEVEPQRKRLRDHHNHHHQQPQQHQQQQQAVPLTNLGTVSSNVHTLKPGHIIAWYIDYLIHENEDRTQISRAFTLPVNLFHTDDFYFLDSLRKKIRFPSNKFLSWMQYHLPSLNAHAIDFREGRPGRESGPHSSVSAWSQDWGWQSKSKRDIIHDVFFYFQHRKAANTDPNQYLGTTTRSKSQLVV